MSGASTSPIPDISRFASLRPVASQLRLLKAVQLSSLDIRTCILNLRQRGYQDFVLSNGAQGRFVYREAKEGSELKGVYIGFALKNIDGDGYTIYGRAVLGSQKINGAAHFIDGYDYIKSLQSQDVCAELLKDEVTALIVSEGIREKYKGIGAALMQITAGIGAAEKKKGIKILQSLSREADKFYVAIGFKQIGEGQWHYSLPPQVLDMPLYPIRPRNISVSGQWRPPEAVDDFSWEIRSLNLLAVKDLMSRGYFDFGLSNGAQARLVYKEVGKVGYYLGLAFKNLDGDGYTIYGRAGFDYKRDGEGNLVISDGDEATRLHKPQNECQELLNVWGTPVYVAESVRKGYKGIGSTLMAVAIQVALMKKASRFDIEMSTANSFYEEMGFTRRGEVTEKNKDDVASFYLDLSDPGLLLSEAKIIPRSHRIKADWRPKEKALSGEDSFVMRLKNFLLSWLGQERFVEESARI